MKKILIVEDDIQVGRMYERAFKMRDYEVQVITDGAAALDVLRKATDLPSVIALDIVIPKLSGKDLLLEFKKDERLKHIPVVMLTNSVHKEEADRYISLGAALYLIKFDHASKDIVDQIDALVAPVISS